MVVHSRCILRQESQGPDGVLAREWGAEAEASTDDKLPLLRSNLPGPSCWWFWRRLVGPDKDVAELAAEAWGAVLVLVLVLVGFGAIAIGAVRETAGE